MHTASQLYSGDFDVEIGGNHVGVPGLFPAWDVRDRFGLVVDGTLDVLGASLLTQAAIAAHYDVRPARRGTCPVYPEIYVFHVGRPMGDHSNYDFWPPRKEVFIPTRSPNALLTEINARGITRLAVPDVAHGNLEALHDGPSTWAEQYSARDRIVSFFAYSPGGEVAEGDVTIRARSARVEQNNHSTLHPLDTARAALLGSNEVTYTAETAPDVPADVLDTIPEDTRRWVETVEARAGEVSAELMQTLIATRETKIAGSNDASPHESYRRLDVEATLAIIASFT